MKPITRIVRSLTIVIAMTVATPSIAQATNQGLYDFITIDDERIFPCDSCRNDEDHADHRIYIALYRLPLFQSAIEALTYRFESEITDRDRQAVVDLNDNTLLEIEDLLRDRAGKYDIFTNVDFLMRRPVEALFYIDFFSERMTNIAIRNSRWLIERREYNEVDRPNMEALQRMYSKLRPDIDHLRELLLSESMY